jgi:DNA-binding MarR family transcriptional regulator
MANRVQTTAEASPTTVTEVRETLVGFASEREQAVVNLWTLLEQVTNAGRAHLARRLDSEAGMLPDEVELLLQLAAAPERRLRMIEVSERLRLSKSGVTRLVDRLEERGLAERALCPSDRRVVYAGITAPGLRALDAAAPAFVRGLVEYIGPLSAAQVAAMSGDLRRIFENGPGGDHDPKAER